MKILNGNFQPKLLSKIDRWVGGYEVRQHDMAGCRQNNTWLFIYLLFYRVYCRAGRNKALITTFHQKPFEAKTDACEVQ